MVKMIAMPVKDAMEYGENAVKAANDYDFLNLTKKLEEIIISR